jgi:hypothetical protein
MLQAIAPLLGIAGLAGASKVALDKAMKDRANREQAGSVGAGRGKQGGPTAKEKNQADMSAAEKEMAQEAADNKYREKADKSPTTKTEMGEAFKRGGSVSSASSRADGCAQRGKTRGTMVMCSGGMAKGKK